MREGGLAMWRRKGGGRGRGAASGNHLEETVFHLAKEKRE